MKPANPNELRAQIQAGVRIVQLERQLERRRQELKDAKAQILEAEKPTVVCLQAGIDSTLSILAAHTESPDPQRITSGLTAMQLLTAQPGLWETACTSIRT